MGSASRTLTTLHQARLGLLGSGPGIHRVDREVLTLGPGRPPREAPVVRHPHDGDVASLHPHHLHPGRHHRLDGDLASR